MENESETETDANSFLEIIERMQADMKHLVDFAEKLKIKQERDTLLQNISTSAKFAIENSEGYFDSEKLMTLITMVSEKAPVEVLRCLTDFKREDVERIKNQLKDIPNSVREYAKNQKKMDDVLIKKIKKVIEVIEKQRLQTNRQSHLDEFYSSKRQKVSEEIPELSSVIGDETET